MQKVGEEKMTLDEAIRHAEEVAQRQDIKEDEEELFSEIFGDMYGEFKTNCTNCAEEHRQLANWLQELKEAKRLLRLAVEDFNCDIDSICAICKHNDLVDGCPYIERYSECEYKWRYTDEALKLIGGDTE